MFRPSAPTLLPLSDSFTLGYVTASSTAVDFTPAAASSEDPLSITKTLLLRSGHSCRSYNRPGMQTALHRITPPRAARESFFGHPRSLRLPAFVCIFPPFRGYGRTCTGWFVTMPVTPRIGQNVLRVQLLNILLFRRTALKTKQLCTTWAACSSASCGYWIE